MKKTITLYFYNMLFHYKNLGKKHREKSPIETYNTIKTFNFGEENYVFKKGKFYLKKTKVISKHTDKLNNKELK